MEITPYQRGYLDGQNSSSEENIWRPNLYETRMDKIAYHHGWKNGLKDRGVNSFG